jgi:hypothetical protein
MNDPILTLRRNDGFSIPQAAPDAGVLAAFSRAGAPDPQDELEDLALASPRAATRSPGPERRLSVVFSAPDAPIPAPMPRRVARSTIVWPAPRAARAYAAVEAAHPPSPHRDRGAGRPIRRALAVAAVTVPMSLSSVPALAFAPPADDPTAAPTVATTAPTLPDPQPSVAADAAPTALEGPSVQPTVTEELSPELIWDSVAGEQVQLTLSDGTSVRAKLLGHEGALLVLARADDGLVVSLPKERVARIQVDTSSGARRASGPMGPIPADGTGLLVGGSLLTIAASPVLITGMFFLGYSPGFSMAFILPGLAGLGGAIPMLVIGAKRKKAYRSWMIRHTFSASVTPTPRGGWTGGLRLRF